MSLKLIVVICVLQMFFCCFCDEYENSYRIKRAKYYTNYPLRFYKSPPPPMRGFSYTPPPVYMDGEQIVLKRPFKLSHQENLEDEDLSNLVKQLSKQNIDKIVELAARKDRYKEQTRQPSENVFKTYGPQFIQAQPFANNQQIPHGYDAPSNYYEPVNTLNAIEQDRPEQIDQYSNVEDTQHNGRGPYPISERDSHRDILIFTNSETEKEEQLPRPQNLREDSDYEISYTNNVPTIVDSDSSLYKLESFADLPLMNFVNSKLETVNSYSVPHYTVTSSRNQIVPQSRHVTSQSTAPQIQVQPAPPRSAAAQQSDAHLKATKIWTHKSTGIAYTLHDDGTLSLEKPARQRPKF